MRYCTSEDITALGIFCLTHSAMSPDTTLVVRDTGRLSSVVGLEQSTIYFSWGIGGMLAASSSSCRKHRPECNGWFKRMQRRPEWLAPPPYRNLAHSESQLTPHKFGAFVHAWQAIGSGAA